MSFAASTFKIICLGGLKMALFPTDQEEVGGALCMHEDFCKPSSEGTLVYLNGGEDLSEPLSRVEAAAGNWEERRFGGGAPSHDFSRGKNDTAKSGT